MTREGRSGAKRLITQIYFMDSSLILYLTHHTHTHIHSSDSSLSLDYMEDKTNITIFPMFDFSILTSLYHPFGLTSHITFQALIHRKYPLIRYINHYFDSYFRQRFVLSNVFLMKFIPNDHNNNQLGFRERFFPSIV